jgi:DNA-binding PucR family transcriptional regulator
VALLGSLAALAAVSIVQSRRAAETAAALAELSVAHAGIQEAAEAHDRFTHVVLSGGGVDDIAAALGELLDCWVVVLDADGQRVAAHGAAPAVDLARSAAVRRSAETGRLAEADGTGAVVVRAAGQELGALVLGTVGAGIEGGRARTVERAAMVTALVLLFRLRAAESDQRVRTDLLADLLARPAGAPDAALVERGRLLGLRLQHPHVLVVARSPSRAVVLAATDAGGGRGLVSTRDDELVAVVPGSDASAVAAAVGAADPTVTVAAAGPVVPGAGLRDAVAEARRTATALAALGRRTGSARDLGFAGLVGGPADVDGYVRSLLGPVLDHDSARGTDLIGTLEAWFAAGGSPRRAASALHVHVNTVAQRLERVSALLGDGWTRPERALEVQLALHLRRLAGGP